MGTLGVGPCRAGSQVCTNGMWDACVGQVVPSSEACNGLDDDCNGIIDDGFADLEAFATWEDIEEDAFIQQQVIRLAIVGDLRWRDKAVLFFLNAVGRFQIDYFKPEHEPLARAWLLAAMPSTRRLAMSFSKPKGPGR